MKIFGAYFWQYRYGIVQFLLFAGIFTGVFFLYDLQIEAVLYAAFAARFWRPFWG